MSYKVIGLQICEIAIVLLCVIIILYVTFVLLDNVSRIRSFMSRDREE